MRYSLISLKLLTKYEVVLTRMFCIRIESSILFFYGNMQVRGNSYYGIFFFSIRIFFHEHSRITGLQGKGEGISLTPHYHFHPLHWHLDISWAITTDSSPLHIVRSRTLTGNLWFPSASRELETAQLGTFSFPPLATNITPESSFKRTSFDVDQCWRRSPTRFDTRTTISFYIHKWFCWWIIV